METLKVKLELNGLKFEMEGREQIVRDEFKDFKDFTQQLLTKVNLTNPIETLDTKAQQRLLTTIEETEYPLLKDIVMQDLPKTEIEWSLVYAFYESNFGKESFLRESIITKYKETGRYTKTRGNHFADNFRMLISKRWIKSKNDKEYILLKEGLDKAIEVISGERQSTIRKKAITILKNNFPKEKTSSTSSKKTQELKLLKDLNLRPEGKLSLKDYAAQFRIESSEELYLVIVCYFKQILHEDLITLNHIFTALIELDKKVPTHLKQVLINIKNSDASNHWLNLENLNNIHYSIRGMNHIKHDIKQDKVNE
jgi:hypothetical protein